MAVVTWTNVYNWGTTTGETFQAQFNLSTGDVQILFDATWNNQGNGYLVGYTPGAGTLDPGATDLSTALAVPVQVASIETLPLEIGSNAPRLGQNWDLTTSNIDPISPIAITFFGDGTQGAGVPLSVIGLNAPGCSIWLNALVGSLTGVSASGSATVTVPIPNNPVLAGQGLTAQSVCLTLRNSANLLTSGGVLGNLGL